MADMTLNAHSEDRRHPMSVILNLPAELET
jgi:hypothetical protein